MLCGVGQVVLPCRSGMEESPLLFSVPAWGSFVLCSQEVEESRSPGVGAQEPTARLGQHSRRRRTVLLKIAPQSSFPRRRESTVPTMNPRSPENHAWTRHSRASGNPLHRKWTPAFAGVTTRMIFIRSDGRKAHDNSPAFAEDKFCGDYIDLQNREKKARMSMKTKDEIKKSRS